LTNTTLIIIFEFVDTIELSAAISYCFSAYHHIKDVDHNSSIVYLEGSTPHLSWLVTPKAYTAFNHKNEYSGYSNSFSL